VIEPKAKMILNKEHYGAVFPRGENGEIRKGTSFYALSTEKDKEEFITSRMTDKPILEAVTEEQFNLWNKKNIIARAVYFRWEEDRKVWSVNNYL